MLICLEASEEDAARMAWTKDVRLFRATTSATHGRPRPGRSTSPARRERVRAGRTRALARDAGADRMVGEPTTFTASGSTAFGDVADATPLLAAARAIKTEQEIERMRLANEIAAGRDGALQADHRAGHERGEIGASGRGSSTAKARAGRARSISPSASRSSGRARDQDVHGDDVAPSSRASRRSSRSGSAPTATGATTRRTSSSASSRRVPRARGAADGVYDDAVDFVAPGASLAELDRQVRAGIDSMGYPGPAVASDLPRRRARAHEPPYAHQAGGGGDRPPEWFLQSSQDAI